LNVFPVPDGDTGTNMLLTMQAAYNEVINSTEDNIGKMAKDIAQGALMGARGNSGVILSQILRGLCETLGHAESLDAEVIATALKQAQLVAFAAVRKPVEGTMLTVLKDSATAAKNAAREGVERDELLEIVAREAFESVRRTPDLLPVLKEAGVVDAGGYGLAILAEAFAAAVEGRELVVDSSTGAVAEVEASANDWDDTEHMYCTEFLLYGEDLDRDGVHDRIVTFGGSELVVGDPGLLKIHVHTDDPAEVLGYATSLGEVAEVHIHNMRRQSVERAAAIAEDAVRAPAKPMGIVAVAAGDGLAEVLRSLGVDVVVSGGQTMNPSTADIVAAIDSVDAEAVIVLPDNKNIIMAAQQAVGVASKPIGVVPTTSVLGGVAALIAFDAHADVATNVRDMTEAAAAVRTGEVTTAIKDAPSKVGPVKGGDVIGITDHEIAVVGPDLIDVASRLVDAIAEDGETLTLAAGADLSPEELAALRERIETAHPDLDIEVIDGGQPLYPVLVSVE
jgi:DAK2 domain fusion protein YloV